MAKPTLKDFLAELAKDPEKLGSFILNPEKAMTEAKIAKKDRAYVKNAIAHFVHTKLIKPPKAYYVI